MKLFAATLVLSLMPFAPLALHAQADHHANQDDGPMPATMHKPPVPLSKSLNVTYAGHTLVLTIADLAAMPQTTVHVHNAHTQQDEDYTGPLLAEVLAKAGLVSNHDTESLILHSAIMAGATDHYFVVFSLAEAEPSFARGQIIVAIMKSGLPDKDGGAIQLINTDGAKPARWVHGLSDLNVMTLQQSR